MIDIQPVISAQLNGVDSRFMVDTGSFFQFLYPSAAAELKLRLAYRPGFYTLGVGGYDNPRSTTVRDFTIAGLHVHDTLFLVSSNDLSQSGIAGILGENLFKVWDDEYDFADGVMRLVVPHHCGNDVLAYWASGQPISTVNLVTPADTAPGQDGVQLIGNASVNGHSIRVLFDTGSSRSMLSLEAAQRIGISPNSPGVVATESSEGMGQQQLVEAWIAPIATFEIGGETIKHTRIAMGRINSRYDTSDDIDMLLGADFFLAHHVYVANSQRKLYFTYSGGPVFDITPSAAAAKSAPAASTPGHLPTASAPAATGATATDAADASLSASDLMRRALAEESRDQLAQALADFTRACNVDAHDADCPYRRGLVHAELHQQDLAFKDFDTAIQLSPDDYQARLARAELRLPQTHDGVKDDLDAVDRQAPPAANLRRRLGQLYAGLGSYPDAIRQVSTWLSYHRDDVEAPRAMASRCWYRAAANIDLDQALDDCNHALRRLSGDADTLDTRGLVYLRLGKPDRAISDYDEALSKNPSTVTSLYGRALAELRKGDNAHGQADIAAAQKLDPRIADFFTGIGLKP